MDQIQPQQQNRPPSGATGYTNLSQYIGANQNNQLGQAVAGGVQQAGQAASGAVQQAGQQFQQGASAEQNRLNQLGQSAQSSLGNLGNIQQSDINTYQSALSGTGQGPTGLANQAGLQQQSQAAQQLGQAGGSEQGRFGLLQRYVGGGKQYNLGQQTLDSAILGQTGQAGLRQARAATSGLGAQANQAIAAANAQGQQLQNQAGQVAQTAQQNLGNAVTGYDTSMAGRVASDKAAQQALISQLSGSGTNAAITLDPAMLQKLSDASGGVLKAGTNLYNTDISPFLQANTTNLSNQGVQTSDDFTRAQALGKLAGTSGLAGTSQGDLLNQYLLNPTAVGTYDKGSPINITSQSGLNDLLKNAGSDYNSQLAALQASQASAQQGAISGQRNLTNLYNESLGSSGLGSDADALKWAGAAGPADQNLINQFVQGSPLREQQLSNAANIQAARQGAGLQVAGDFGTSNDPGGQGYLNAVQSFYGGQAAPIYGQYQQSEKAIADTTAKLAALGPQFNVLRTLQATPAAASANPILGNGGQPLSNV